MNNNEDNVNWDENNISNNNNSINGEKNNNINKNDLMKKIKTNVNENKDSKYIYIYIYILYIYIYIYIYTYMLLKQGYWISKSFTIIIYLKIESYIQLQILNVSMPVVHLIHATTEMIKSS